MTTNLKNLARATLEGSESGAMTFPQSLGILMEAGFDSYAVDFRRSTRTYYMPNGEATELQTEPTPTMPNSSITWRSVTAQRCSASCGRSSSTAVSNPSPSIEGGHPSRKPERTPT